MTVDSHINTLIKKHGNLEAEIAQTIAHPSVSDLILTSLKRKKLYLKQEIERLKGKKS